MRRTVLFAVILALFSSLSVFAQNDDDMAKSLQKLHRLFTILENNYVDQYNSSKAAEDAIKAILKELDPHSNYLTADELRKSNEPLQGSFEGVGITYNNDDDTLVVISTVENGPADRAGVCPGDRVIYVGDSLISGIKISAARISGLLRGKKGTEILLRIIREDEQDTLSFKIKRDKVPIESVTSYYMATPQIGYVKVVRFGAKTADDLRAVLKKFNKQGITGLILDLRGNPGGYLHTAVDMLSEFVEKSSLVVYTEGKGSKRKDYFTKNGGIFQDGKIAVLIDEGSASASEIVSGALQDLDRGIVIGRRSFGKGLVQNTFEFPDKSAARITTARYYTPSGRYIQRPYNQGKDKYYEEIKKRFDSGELTSLDSIHLPDSLKFYTINKRTVYGGGGIMPDIFVPLDTLSNDSLVKIMNRKNFFYRFAVRYVNGHRKELTNKHKTPELFKEQFSVDNGILEEFSSFCVNKGDPFSWSSVNEKVLRYSEISIKANIARVLWNETAFLHIMNERDETYRQAINAIENDLLNEMVLAR